MLVHGLATDDASVAPANELLRSEAEEKWRKEKGWKR
jgi:hypothetical protein